MEGLVFLPAKPESCNAAQSPWGSAGREGTEPASWPRSGPEELRGQQRVKQALGRLRSTDKAHLYTPTITTHTKESLNVAEESQDAPNMMGHLSSRAVGSPKQDPFKTKSEM